MTEADDIVMECILAERQIQKVKAEKLNRMLTMIRMKAPRQRRFPAAQTVYRPNLIPFWD